MSNIGQHQKPNNLYITLFSVFIMAKTIVVVGGQWGDVCNLNTPIDFRKI